MTAASIGILPVMGAEAAGSVVQRAMLLFTLGDLIMIPLSALDVRPWKIDQGFAEGDQNLSAFSIEPNAQIGKQSYEKSTNSFVLGLRLQQEATRITRFGIIVGYLFY
jgi:hypothetical protein